MTSSRRLWLALATACLVACSGKTTTTNEPVADSGVDQGSGGGGQAGSAGADADGGNSGSGGTGSGGTTGEDAGCVADPNCSGKPQRYCVGNELRTCGEGQACSVATNCAAICAGCGCHVAPPANGVLRAACDSCQSNADCDPGTVCGVNPELPDSKAKGCVMGN